MSSLADTTIDDPNLLFRFALLLTGNVGAAGEAVTTALKNGGQRMAQIRDGRRRRAILLEQIVAAAPASNAESVELIGFQELPEDVSVISDAGSALIPAIAQLPDPLRMVSAYFYSNLFSAEELPPALGWQAARTAQTLQQARHVLIRSLEHPAAAERTGSESQTP